MYYYVKLSLLAVAIAMTGAAAYIAKAHIQNDTLAVTQAETPLTQAVAAAEQHANDRASRAEYKQSKQSWVYDMEVVSRAKVFDVRIDTDKGTIISAIEDKADYGDIHNKQD